MKQYFVLHAKNIIIKLELGQEKLQKWICKMNKSADFKIYSGLGPLIS